MNDDQLFWLVWSPTGTTPPSHRHSSAHAAIVEAERLARSAPNAKFYVLKATDVRYIDAMQRVILVDRDQPPF